MDQIGATSTKPKNTLIGNHKVDLDHLERIEQTAIASAMKAGEILCRYFGCRLSIENQSAHDVKLEVDLMCEASITQQISEIFPDHSIVSEEMGSNDKTSNFIWIIDPLDGSLNYYHSIPFFCVCISCYYVDKDENDNYINDGLSQEAIPLVGVVYAPINNELFVGVIGQKARLNNQLIHPGPVKKLNEAVFSLSYGSKEETMKHMDKVSAILARKVRKIRILGSTGLEMAHVACGRISGLYQRSVHLWDFAAAKIILEQSGGKFDARQWGSNNWEILACTANIFESAHRLLLNPLL